MSYIPPQFQPGRLCKARYLVRGLIILLAGLTATVHAETFVLPPPGVSVIGEMRVVKALHEDTLSNIARRYNVGYQEIVAANPTVDPWLPGEGTEILVPSQYILPDAPREGIVVNIPEMRLYYYPPAKAGEIPLVVTFPMSVGRQDWQTPLGTTKIVKKTANPAWYPPQSIRDEHAEQGEFLPARVAPGPDNPLGDHALRLGMPGYLIHGTNKPYGIGMRATHGCVRLYPEDIRYLFESVPVGTSVHIVNQPFKAGWRNGLMYMEAHAPLEEEAELYDSTRTPVVEVLVKASPHSRSEVDWDKVNHVVDASRGLPTVVSTERVDMVAVLNRTQLAVREKINALLARPLEE